MNLLLQMKKVAILGGHGDGLVAAQIIRDLQQQGQKFSLAGFLNDGTPEGSSIAGYPVLGKTNQWRKLPDDIALHCCLTMLTEAKVKEAMVAADISMDLDTINSSDLLSDHDLDSLDMFNLLLELQEVTGVSVADEEIEKLVSIQAILDHFKD